MREKKEARKLIESSTYIQNHVSGVHLCLRLNGVVQTSTCTFIVCNIQFLPLSALPSQLLTYVVSLLILAVIIGHAHLPQAFVNL